MNLRGKTVLIFGGKTGLLGQSLTAALKAAKAKPKPLSSRDCDILDVSAVSSVLDKYDADIVINAAAYTQVDLAEEEQELAFALNATAPALMAAEAAKRGIPFVHFSTDFVFRGDKTEPYSVYDEPSAYSVYGISKAEGEKNLLSLGYDNTLIIRTSWLFGPGKINFVAKILSLCEQRDTLTVVSDQIGSPSYTPDVSIHTLQLMEADATGIYHIANSGITSWFGLASASVSLAAKGCSVNPVSSSAYPTAATRPKYSALDLSRFIKTTGVTPRHWEEALKEYISDTILDAS
ncbi:dTDP-4-dehydrorhamnose reductase [Pseudodesulfovibrio profundus]|uniref:dTDP-4-dehydrorhamnose reductase n=1 Tax=Pseudodesulfovibrio profundus TaxID=57320 RepID=A0A2C8F3B8_9BACT|nr:dTDP-4-dehydrorhamnose reductase [Pseudodesulfovibrio profundus]SOB57041.1 dTDP-4-dehydrorhamnose reductase [Pseudodesulfovibrio profundus]